MLHLQGVIAAAALKCMGGSIQGRLWARNEEEAEAICASGRDTTRILYTEDLVRGNDVSVEFIVAYIDCSKVLWLICEAIRASGQDIARIMHTEEFVRGND
jgi:hypothetical protein